MNVLKRHTKKKIQKKIKTLSMPSGLRKAKKKKIILCAQKLNQINQYS